MTCPFPNHPTALADDEALSAHRAGYCPLCLHDYAFGPNPTTGEAVCIECGHTFVLTFDTQTIEVTCLD